MRTSQALTLMLAVAAIAFVFPSPVAAQDLEGQSMRRRIKEEERPSNSAPSSSPSRRRTTPVRMAPVARSKVVTPKTGTLSVATEPLTNIIVEPVGGTARARRSAFQGTVPDGEGVVIFNYLQPGRYKVSAELNGYKPASSEIEIRANTPSSLTLHLEPITYDITIETNVSRGEIRYETKGEPSRVIPFNGGKAVIAGLRGGTYDIDVRSDEVGYQTLLGIIEVGEGKTRFKTNLNRRLSKETFSDSWYSLEGWDVPGTWSIVSRKLSVNGRGVALPRNENYRHYTDFQLMSNVRMINGVALSLAVRAADARNYYLIQLTGAKADEPHVLRAFLVRNGTAQRLQPPIPIESYAETIKPGQFFELSLTAIDNKFTVRIKDSMTGEDIPLGVITDPNRNFSIGAVGIVARDGEQNEIGPFTVCYYPECPKGMS